MQLIILGKHSLMIHPELPKRLIRYVEFGRNAIKKIVDQAPPEATTEALTKIAEAEALIAQLEQLGSRVTQIHEIEFYAIADAYVKTLKDLGFSRIEDVYTLDVSIANITSSLKERNPYFSANTFRSYVNNGGK